MHMQDEQRQVDEEGGRFRSARSLACVYLVYVYLYNTYLARRKEITRDDVTLGVYKCSEHRYSRKDHCDFVHKFSCVVSGISNRFLEVPADQGEPKWRPSIKFFPSFN